MVMVMVMVVMMVMVMMMMMVMVMMRAMDFKNLQRSLKTCWQHTLWLFDTAMEHPRLIDQHPDLPMSFNFFSDFP